MSDFWKKTVELFFPEICAGCRRIGSPTFCDACLAGIPRYDSLYCIVCRARLPDTGTICHSSSPLILGAIADYANEPIRNAIHALKFEGAFRVAEPLGKMMAGYLSGLNARLDDYILVPLPLSKKRAAERGFNQAEMLAKAVGKRTGHSVRCDWLIRARHSDPQSSLPDRADRAGNIAGCFSVPDSASVRKQKIILIDDVSTSGATLMEAARVLKSAGADKIIGLVLARA